VFRIGQVRIGHIKYHQYFFFFFQFWFYFSTCIFRRRMGSSSILSSLFLIDINIIRSFGSSVSIFNIHMNLASTCHFEVSSKKHWLIPMCFGCKDDILNFRRTVRERFCASPKILIIRNIAQYWDRDIEFWKDRVSSDFVRLRKST
jgi:hypothetical protein